MNNGFKDLIPFANQMAEITKFSGIVEGGFCWDALTKERLKNPKSLEPYGYKVYSQNDEDGIIQEIFKRIGTKTKIFIEFGVQNGLESNSHLLLFYGWKGLWIEGSSEFCEEIKIKFKPIIYNKQLRVVNMFITKDNINELIKNSGFEGEIDLLSIDIDGNDYYIWEAINVVDPRVVIIEYNAKFPPNLNWRQAYNATHIWRGDDWHGASLKALEGLALKKGYTLVGTNLRGCNAFFVRNDLVEDEFYNKNTAEALYNPLRLQLIFRAAHQSKYCLAVQKEELGLLNYKDYELISGFHEIEVSNGKECVWTSEVCSFLKLLLKAGKKSIKLPYTLPKEVVKKYPKFRLEIETSFSKKVCYNIREENGVLNIDFDNIVLEDMIIKMKITNYCLWRPTELLSSSDNRLLGINIGLSAITFL